MDKLQKQIDSHYKLIKDNLIEEQLKIREQILEDITTTDNMLIAIIKGNLILENKLKDLLVKYGLDEKLVENKYKYFNDKLNLCFGLNIIEQDIVNPLNKMNNTRNKYGHNINFKITQPYLEEMVSSLSASGKSLYENILNMQGYTSLEGDDMIFKHVVTFIEVIYISLKTTEDLMFYKKANIIRRFYVNILKEINNYKNK